MATAAEPSGDRHGLNVCFWQDSTHQPDVAKCQLVTHRVIWRSPITALQKVYSITSSASTLTVASARRVGKGAKRRAHAGVATDAMTVGRTWCKTVGTLRFAHPTLAAGKHARRHVWRKISWRPKAS
jgi:hypothetical protein